jgi:formylglycine-generating enzyme required for sulfatase activity
LGTGYNATDRVQRGGSWNNDADNCRAAYRNYSTPGNRNPNLGFRPAKAPLRPNAGVERIAPIPALYA